MTALKATHFCLKTKELFPLKPFPPAFLVWLGATSRRLNV